MDSHPSSVVFKRSQEEASVSDGSRLKDKKAVGPWDSLRRQPAKILLCAAISLSKQDVGGNDEKEHICGTAISMVTCFPEI